MWKNWKLNYCCNWKARAASAQSFTLWQQAAIEIMCCNHSLRTLVILFNRSQASIGRDYSLWHPIIACSCHIYMGAIVCAHPIRRNANGEVVTTSHPFYNEPHRSHIFLWSLHLAWPSHPGHSTILLQSGSPSGKCAKLHTVATSKNRDHTPQSLFAYASHFVQSFTS